MTDKDPDQMELPLKDNVKSFIKKPKLIAKDTSENDDLIKQGLELFISEMSKDAKGFLSIVFDKDDHPSTIWAGDIDLLTALGAIEMSKQELISHVDINMV